MFRSCNTISKFFLIYFLEETVKGLGTAHDELMAIHSGLLDCSNISMGLQCLLLIWLNLLLSHGG